MSYQSSVADFAFDAPVNQTPVHKSPVQTSQLPTRGKMVNSTSLIYGPALLLLLAACANGNTVTNLGDGPQGGTEQPEDETQGGTEQPEDGDASVTITGTDEDDELTVVTSHNVVRGLGGNDDIYGGDGFDTVDYSDSTSSVYLFLDDYEYLGSTYGDLLLDAQDERFEEGGEFGPNDDVYNIETVILSDFDDQVSADGFATVFDGGAGTDTLIFANSIEAVTIDLRGGVDDEGYYVMAPSLSPGERSDAFERGTKFKNFERIAGSPEDDTFYGADDADFFFLAGDGDDTLISGKGSDTFHAGHWRDGGFDVVDYSRAEGGIRVDLNDLDDNNFATITIDHADWKDDSVKYVEDVIGSAHDDTFSGEVDVTNYFTGGTGRDVFYADDWEHGAGVEYNFDVVTDFEVGTDKIGFWVRAEILNAHFSPGNENVEGFFAAFGISQQVNDADNRLIIKRLGVTILEIEDYSGTEVLDMTNFTLSLDVA